MNPAITPLDGIIRVDRHDGSTTQRIAPPATTASTTKIRKRTIAMVKRIFAMPAVAEDTPEKPKNPAITETTAAMIAHLNIWYSLTAFKMRCMRQCYVLSIHDV